MQGEASLAALWSKAEIDQAGLPSQAEVEQWQVSGIYRASPRLSASGRVGARFIDQPTTATAYTRQVNTADLRLRYRLTDSATLRAGWNQSDYERINRTHTMVDTPSRRRLWANLRANLPHKVRLAVKYTSDQIDDNPAAAIPVPGAAGLADVRPLYRDDRTRFDARLAAPISDHTVSYLFYTVDRVANATRALSYDLNTFGLGLDNQMNSRWTVNVDFQRTHWGNDGSAALTDVVNIGLNSGLLFLTDDDALTVTSTYLVDANTWLSGFITRYRGGGGNLSSDRYYGVTVRRSLHNDLSFAVTWQRAFHDDLDPSITPAGGLDFSDNVWRVELTGRF